MTNASKYSDLPFKDKAATMTALVSFTLGWLLIFIGLLLPPIGEISPSVLTAFGTALVYTAGVFGIFLYIKGSQGEVYAKVMEEVIEKIEQHKKKHLKDEDDEVATE